MVRRSLVALSLVALLGGTGVALAQDTQTKPAPEARQHGMGRLQAKLGLTDDQMAVVRVAHQKVRPEQKQVWQQLRVAQADLRQLALNGGDTGAIQAKTAEVQQLIGQTVALRVKVLQEIGPVLTPEQRAKFAQASFQHGHGKRFHRKPAPTQS
jgi:Spy/CpxP family protein refolding chaperone